MLSLTAGMRYKYCEGNVSFRYKWDAMINYIRYVLHEDPWSGTVFIFMNRRHNQLRVFYYERGGFVISEKKLDRQYKFLTHVLTRRSKLIPSAGQISSLCLKISKYGDFICGRWYSKNRYKLLIINDLSLKIVCEKLA